MSNNYADDEALARALQEEFSREMNRQQRARQNRTGGGGAPLPSAPREEVIRGQGVTETDEQYARRIAQEEERLYQFHQRQQQSLSSRNNSSSRDSERNSTGTRSRPPVDTATSAAIYDVKRTGSDDTPATSREGSTVTEFEDAEYARRVEQELHDEEIARRLQENDEIRASRNAAREAATQVEPRPRFTFNCICGYIMFFTFVGAAAVAFMYFFYIRDNEMPGRWIWDPEEFADEDPFDAKRPEDVTPWRSNKRGLSVEVLNALDDSWYPFFYEAVLDWDSGYPDSLTLSTSTTEPDPDCREVAGKVKVCNGDYGQTSWKGINEIHIDGSGYIYASTARLNDFYFDGNTGSMQYTMCHELGHAWGLPHTDEIFGNKDLGNCMDYTHNEDKNKTPDESNYNFLFQLYGLVPGAEPYDPPTAAPTISPAPTMAPTIELVGTSEQIEPNDFAPGNNGKNDKGGKNGNRSLESSLSEEEIATMLVDARERIMSGSTKNVRLLHRGVRGEIHEADMANGHRLRVHKLLPVA